MMDIDKKITETSGRYKEETLELLNSEIINMRDSLDTGVEPDLFHKLEKYIKALEISFKILKAHN